MTGYSIHMERRPGYVLVLQLYRLSSCLISDPFAGFTILPNFIATPSLHLQYGRPGRTHYEYNTRYRNRREYLREFRDIGRGYQGPSRSCCTFCCWIHCDNTCHCKYRISASRSSHWYNTNGHHNSLLYKLEKG